MQTANRRPSATIRRIVNAKGDGAIDDPEVKRQCCTRLQKINGMTKQRVADMDAQIANEAMKGGVTGLGCDHPKLISVLCTRTKAALARTRVSYRSKYDKDFATEVKSETSSNYGNMMAFALAMPEEYVADIIHASCGGWGCDEEALIELCLTRSTEQLLEGKKVWEGRNDKSLTDYIDKNLGHSYRHLKYLINQIFKGKRTWDGDVNEERATRHVEKLHKECSKGYLQSFKEDKVVDWLLSGPPAENELIAQIYEKHHDKSLKSALEAKCGKKFFLALSALLLPPEEFLAMRMEQAMKGWGTDSNVLVRILGGLDHASKPSMCQVRDAYQRKYTRTLKDALRSELSGNFLKASIAWIDALDDPSQHLEVVTNVDVATTADGDLDQLIDDLLTEHESVDKMMASIDAQEIYNCIHGWGTSDTKLIELLCSRSKPHLQKIAEAYYTQRDGQSKTTSLLARLRKETSGWYRTFVTYLVESPEDADVRALDAAMDGLGADAVGLIEFLVGRSNARVRAAKEKWEGKHDAPLVDRIRSELHGSNQTLALELLKGERDESSTVDSHKAKKQAEQLHKAASGWGSADDGTFIQVLAKNSPAQNKATRDAYEKKYNKSLESLTAKVGNKNMQKCLQALLLDPADYYAMRIRQSFVGLGTSDKVVCRVLGGSDKPDALAIAAAYKRKYGTVLKDGIQKECSGKYKRVAQAWVTLPDALEDPEAPIELPDEIDEEEDKEQPSSSDDEPEPAPAAPPPPAAVPVYQPPPPGTFQVVVPSNAGPGSQLIVRRRVATGPRGRPFTTGLRRPRRPLAAGARSDRPTDDGYRAPRRRAGHAVRGADARGARRTGAAGAGAGLSRVVRQGQEGP